MQTIKVQTTLYTLAPDMIKQSRTLQNMFDDCEPGTIPELTSINQETWEIIQKYLKSGSNVALTNHTWQACEYMDIPDLRNKFVNKMRDLLKNGKINIFRDVLDIKDDLTQLEHEKIQSENRDIHLF